MKSHLLSATLLTICCIIFFSGIYTVAMLGIAQLAPNQGKGVVITSNGKTYYANIAQKFTDDKYFWSRPSAVNYNAAGSGGSNKGPTNPDYLALVQARIDTFSKYNPSVSKSDIPSELVTASGSGLDPNLSVQGARVQAARIAKARGISEALVTSVIQSNIEKPMFGILGPEKVNVLKLNLELDELK